MQRIVKKLRRKRGKQKSVRCLMELLAMVSSVYICMLSENEWSQLLMIAFFIGEVLAESFPIVAMMDQENLLSFISGFSAFKQKKIAYYCNDCLNLGQKQGQLSHLPE